MLKFYGGWWLILQTPSLNESRSAHPCIQIQQSIAQPIHPSVHQSIWSSIYPRTQGHKNAGRGAHMRTQWRTHTCTHLNPPIPPTSDSPSVAHIQAHTLSTHIHTLEHAHTYTYIYAYSPGPVAQFAARQICNLSSVHESWYRTQLQPDNFRGDWSWDSFYRHFLSTAESSKAVEINWRKYVLFVLVNCLGGPSMSGYSVCRLTDRVRHYLNSVYLAVKRQSNKIHTY